jgi:hypothetical protein
MPFNPAGKSNFGPTGSMKDFLAKAAALKAEQDAKALATSSPEAPEALAETKKAITYGAPEKMPERIGIVFDDSGSMHGTPIKNAREGVIEFMRYCTMNLTSVGVFKMSSYEDGYNYGNLLTSEGVGNFTANLPALAAEVATFSCIGTTPMYATVGAALAAPEKPTRLVVFSDGSPDDDDVLKCKKVTGSAIAAKVPVDTIFFSNFDVNTTDEEYDAFEKTSDAVANLKELAHQTGGVFIFFKPGKTTFKRIMAALSPGRRLALTDGNYLKALQEGEV